MKNKSEIVRRLEKLEEIRNAPSKQDQREVLEKIERSIAEAGDYAERPENKALEAELSRQYKEYLKEPREPPKDGFDAQMKFWLWRVKKGYLSRENLAKLAGHENSTCRQLNELVGKKNATLPDTPYPDFPEYDSTEEHELDYEFVFLPSESR